MTSAENQKPKTFWDASKINDVSGLNIYIGKNCLIYTGEEAELLIEALQSAADRARREALMEAAQLSDIRHEHDTARLIRDLMDKETRA